MEKFNISSSSVDDLLYCGPLDLAVNNKRVYLFLEKKIKRDSIRCRKGMVELIAVSPHFYVVNEKSLLNIDFDLKNCSSLSDSFKIIDAIDKLFKTKLPGYTLSEWSDLFTLTLTTSYANTPDQKELNDLWKQCEAAQNEANKLIETYYKKVDLEIQKKFQTRMWHCRLTLPIINRHLDTYQKQTP